MDKRIVDEEEVLRDRAEEVVSQLGGIIGKAREERKRLLRQGLDPKVLMLKSSRSLAEYNDLYSLVRPMVLHGAFGLIFAKFKHEQYEFVSGIDIAFLESSLWRCYRKVVKCYDSERSRMFTSFLARYIKKSYYGCVLVASQRKHILTRFPVAEYETLLEKRREVAVQGALDFGLLLCHFGDEEYRKFERMQGSIEPTYACHCLTSPIVEDLPLEAGFAYWRFAKKTLNKRSYMILWLRLVESNTLEEIATKIGLTYERVRQLEARAIKKLQYHLLPNPDLVHE